MPKSPHALPDLCLCGCGEMANAGRWYLPGHDSKHLSKAGKAIVAGDAVSGWLTDMPSQYQASRLRRYLTRRGIDMDALAADERQDCA